MKKRYRLLATILTLFIPACGGVLPGIVSEPSPQPTVSQIVFVTRSPATATETPLPPTSTATLVMAEQATATPVPQPTVTPTETPLPEPTATATPTPEPDWLNTAGRTQNNLVYLGNPAAPVTMIDYSDFM
jgi:hypothetical protein